jgi:hypothetical protein
MFLHIGGNTAIPISEIVMIMDSGAAASDDASVFLKRLRNSGKYEDISDGAAKSFVLTDSRAYASPISAVTLKKRLENVNLIFSNKKTTPGTGKGMENG